MREIKFRGKLISDDFRTKYINGWIYGDYLKNDVSHFIITGFNEGHDNSGYPSIDINFWQKVVSNTVGQFTGLYDKNGKEIYEGDIVREHANDYTPIYQNGIYMAYNVDKINDPYVSTQFNVIWRNGCEVIGNIHDNPELLERESK